MPGVHSAKTSSIQVASPSFPVVRLAIDLMMGRDALRTFSRKRYSTKETRHGRGGRTGKAGTFGGCQSPHRPHSTC